MSFVWSWRFGLFPRIWPVVTWYPRTAPPLLAGALEPGKVEFVERGRTLQGSRNPVELLTPKEGPVSRPSHHEHQRVLGQGRGDRRQGRSLARLGMEALWVCLRSFRLSPVKTVALRWHGIKYSSNLARGHWKRYWCQWRRLRFQQGIISASDPMKPKRDLSSLQDPLTSQCESWVLSCVSQIVCTIYTWLKLPQIPLN